MEVKHVAMAGDQATQGLFPNNNNHFSNQDKKKRLTTDQLDSLERSFHEDIKLDPDRKMKLSRELGLHPRQIAVWFQNRRARWKTKQLERLYDTLKNEFDTVFKEKQKLQDEVLKLKSMLIDQGTKNKQLSTEISGEETTVESTSVAIRSSIIINRQQGGGGGGAINSNHEMADGNYSVFNVDEYNPPVNVASPYWGVLPLV
ncbi:hypothetical protein ACFE04_001293 [Oxalis oulophora]